MMEENKGYNSVYWFLVDGMSPDYLNVCGNYKAETNYFDELLSRGSVFSDVATTAAGTHTSMHSIFCSLMPSCNGASGWAREALRNFRQEIYTITDIFKLYGYRTYRYCDADGERTVPMSGFDVWESSSYKISELLTSTDMCRTERREQFIEEVNAYSGKKFVYHHSLLLHELNAKMGEIWTSEGYLDNIRITAYYFRELYRSYKITEEDLVIISSDHGVMLDIPWQGDGIKNGERHYEQSVKAFWALIGEKIPPQILDKRISALDIAPTLLKVLFNLDYKHQGVSRDQYLYQAEYVSLPCYREKGSYTVAKENQNPMCSDVYYVWKDNWKYVYGERDARCEWLIDLGKDKDYSVNLKKSFPDKVDYLRNMIKTNIFDPVIADYLNADRENLFPEKKIINKFFSVVIDMPLESSAWEDLLDLGGPYYELLYRGKEDEIPLKYQKNYKIKIIGKTNKKNDDELLQHCLGEWIVFLNPYRCYSEYFLSDLYRKITTDINISKLKGKGFTAYKKGYGKSANTVQYKESQVRCFRYEKNTLIVEKRIGKILKKLMLIKMGKGGERSAFSKKSTN